MKNAIYTVITFAALAFSTTAVAQTASTLPSGEFKEAQKENVYVFFTPGSVTADVALVAADEFQAFMDIDFDEDRGLLKVNLISGHISNRRQIARMLEFIEVEEMRIDGAVMGIHDFADSFIINI